LAKPSSSDSEGRSPNDPPGRPIASRDVYIARQPIFDLGQRVVGYELLFRASDTAEAFSGAAEQASARVIADALGAFGLDVITHGRLAFINLPRKLVVEGMAKLLPPRKVVLELLEEIEGDEEILDSCQRLEQEGYQLALDDFIPRSGNLNLIPLVDYVKADISVITDLPDWIRQVRKAHAGSGPGLVAEHIETPDDYRRAREAGMTHFQGFFLGKPATQRARRIPDAQLGYLRLLRAMRDPELTLVKIEELIKPDPTLCFRVLRTVNSAGFGLRAEVGSIREALVLLGRDPVRRWVSLWAMVSLTDGSHSELLLNSITRARLCELLWTNQGNQGSPESAFLLGMCSLLDAIFDAPMETIVSQLPLDENLRAALLGDDNAARRLLDAVVAYERGDWNGWPAKAEAAGLPLQAFATASADAIRWANEACAQGALAASA
jgi:EAL and modified HD-GYP domain-containing signal transduction protein